MTDAPTPPASPLPEGWQPMPPAARKVAAIVGALAALPFVAGATALLSVLFVPTLAGRLLVVAGLAVLLCGAGLAFGRARWRRSRWRLDARGLQVQRGVIWRSEVLVPRSRVQHLDIERGPIERRFGLATLVAHTAGTRMNALRQSGFIDADAVALRDALLPEASRHDDAL